MTSCMDTNTQEVTQLLSGLKQNDFNLVEQIYPIVYNHLKRVARAWLKRELGN